MFNFPVTPKNALTKWGISKPTNPTAPAKVTDVEAKIIAKTIINLLKNFTFKPKSEAFSVPKSSKLMCFDKKINSTIVMSKRIAINGI